MTLETDEFLAVFVFHEGRIENIYQDLFSERYAKITLDIIVQELRAQVFVFQVYLVAGMPLSSEHAFGSLFFLETDEIGCASDQRNRIL